MMKKIWYRELVGTRQWIYDEPGTTIVKFRNIQPYGTIAEVGITFTGDTSGRLADFGTIVYENTEKTFITEKIVQPRQTVPFYYELAVALIIAPAVMLLGIVIYMKTKKPSTPSRLERKASPV